MARAKRRARIAVEEVGGAIERTIGELLSDHAMETEGAIRELDAKAKRVSER